MHIRVIGYNELKELAADLPDGLLELDADATVRTALSNLATSESDLVLFVNGRAAGLDTRLKDGDTLVVFAPIAGG
jgi:molybdopterin converting factor small subunit